MRGSKWQQQPAYLPSQERHEDQPSVAFPPICHHGPKNPKVRVAEAMEWAKHRNAKVEAAERLRAERAARKQWLTGEPRPPESVSSQAAVKLPSLFIPSIPPPSCAALSLPVALQVPGPETVTPRQENLLAVNPLDRPRTPLILPGNLHYPAQEGTPRRALPRVILSPVNHIGESLADPIHRRASQALSNNQEEKDGGESESKPVRRYSLAPLFSSDQEPQLNLPSKPFVSTSVEPAPLPPLLQPQSTTSPRSPRSSPTSFASDGAPLSCGRRRGQWDRTSTEEVVEAIRRVGMAKSKSRGAVVQRKSQPIVNVDDVTEAKAEHKDSDKKVNEGEERLQRKNASEDKVEERRGVQHTDQKGEGAASKGTIHASAVEGERDPESARSQNSLNAEVSKPLVQTQAEAKKSAQRTKCNQEKVNEGVKENESKDVASEGLAMAGTRKKQSTLKATQEIEKRRSERREKQLEDRKRRTDEVKAHGDDEGYKFRRLIQSFRQKVSSAELSFNVPPDNPSSRLTVCIRKRPLNSRERETKMYDIVTAVSSRVIVCHEPKIKLDLSHGIDNHNFVFDRIFGEDVPTDAIYHDVLKPQLGDLLKGGSLTVFAYGQTGSGKTFTMRHLYEAAFRDLLSLVSSSSPSLYELSLSYYELYKTKVLDLINNKKEVQVMESGEGVVHIVGLREIQVTTAEEVLDIMRKGQECRHTSANAEHADSSRSHSLLRINICKKKEKGQLSPLSTLSLVDLAGNERASDMQNDDKATRQEGAEINKSLLALKECIRAMDAGASHVPFRGSKLTQILRDSFIGRNAKTLMIATVSPTSKHANYTLNTLRYAERLKEAS